MSRITVMRTKAKAPRLSNTAKHRRRSTSRAQPTGGVKCRACAGGNSPVSTTLLGRADSNTVGSREYRELGVWYGAACLIDQEAKPSHGAVVSRLDIQSRLARVVLPVAVVVCVADRLDSILSNSRVLEKAHLSSQRAVTFCPVPMDDPVVQGLTSK